MSYKRDCGEYNLHKWLAETMVQRCFVKTVVLKISENLQENICARVTFLIKLQTSCEISKNTFFQRTPLGAASGLEQFSGFQSVVFDLKMLIFSESIFFSGFNRFRFII